MSIVKTLIRTFILKSCIELFSENLLNNFSSVNLDIFKFFPGQKFSKIICDKKTYINCTFIKYSAAKINFMESSLTPFIFKHGNSIVPRCSFIESAKFIK